MTSTMVSDKIDEPDALRFELGPTDADGFWSEDPVARVQDAMAAVEGVKSALARVNAGCEGAVESGIKVGRMANWLVAGVATDDEFEVTLTWHPSPAQ